MTAPLNIVAVPAFSDNYHWLVHDPASGETVVVDPGDPAPVLAEAGRRGWTIDQVWNTHWHPDHVGGNAAIAAATGARITAPAAEADRIVGADRYVADGHRVAIGRTTATVAAVPGHTLGHVAYFFDAQRVAFVGDTLFAMGCGRLFEGTAAQMHDSLQRIAALPVDTALYPAHEYTLANARFAAAAEPDNAAIAERLAAVTALRARGAITLPTTVAQERATNPFVRAADAAALAELRAWKDRF